MFFNDKPINDITEDILGRADFSLNIAKTFSKYEITESLVISLNGAWGSGKTSVINMIQRICLKEYPDKIKVVKFNPWYYSDKSNLILKFFETVFASELLIKDKRKKKKIYSTIKEYTSCLESATSFVPIVSSGLKAVKEFSDSKAQKYISQLDDIEKQKEKVEKIFSNLDYKLLVIIDDIDRLSSHEIRDIFQLVKLVADLPNIIYLLSFDVVAVRKALDDFQNGKGEEYLEKIVQVPFYLPDISNKELEKYLTTNIDKIIKDVKEEDFSRERWNTLYLEGLKYLFINLRHVNRFINVLGFEFNLVKDDVNVVDFMGITAIKIFYPDLYDIIKTNKSLFVKGGFKSAFDYLNTNDEEIYKSELNTLLKDFAYNKRLINIIINLFPKTRNAIKVTYSSHEDEDFHKNRLEQRICNEDCFDIYFKLSIPSEIISNSEMKDVLNAEDEDQISTKLIKLNELGKITDFLSRVEDFKDFIKETNLTKLIYVFLNIGNSFVNDPGISSIFRADSLIIRLIYILLGRINDKQQRSNILKECISRVSNDISLSVLIITRIDSSYGRFGRDDQKTSIDNLLIEEDCLDKLEILGLKKIEEYALNKKLLETSDFISILYRWKEWEGGKVGMTNFFNEMYKDKHTIVILLKKFAGITNHFNSNNTLTNSTYFLDYKYVKEFLDVDLIYKELKSLTDEDINKLDDFSKDVIKFYFEDYEGKVRR